MPPGTREYFTRKHKTRRCAGKQKDMSRLSANSLSTLVQLRASEMETDSSSDAILTIADGVCGADCECVFVFSKEQMCVCVCVCVTAGLFFKRLKCPRSESL